MTTLIVLFGALTLVTGILILFNPEIVFGYLRKHHQTPGIHILAVGVRLALGALLISQAELSRYPLALAILGWLSIVAALTFAAMGRDRFKRLMSWALNEMMPYGRIGGAFAAAFGGFLIHAFV